MEEMLPNVSNKQDSPTPSANEVTGPSQEPAQVVISSLTDTIPINNEPLPSIKEKTLEYSSIVINEVDNDTQMSITKKFGLIDFNLLEHSGPSKSPYNKLSLRSTVARGNDSQRFFKKPNRESLNLNTFVPPSETTSRTLV
jgi:hypothetical protein